MDLTDHDWKRLGAAVASARRAAGFTKTTKWVEATGVSDRSLLGLERGERRGASTLTAVEQALGWHPGWAYRILTGQVRGGPAPDAARPFGPESGRAQVLLHRLREMAEESVEISIELSILMRDMEESQHEPAKTEAVDTPTAAPPDYALASHEGIAEINFPRHAQDADAEAPQVSPDDH